MKSKEKYIKINKLLNKIGFIFGFIGFFSFLWFGSIFESSIKNESIAQTVLGLFFLVIGCVILLRNDIFNFLLKVFEKK